MSDTILKRFDLRLGYIYENKDSTRRRQPGLPPDLRARPYLLLVTFVVKLLLYDDAVKC